MAIAMKALFSFILLVCLGSVVSAAEKPNIVLLFADDAGYGDFGFHNSKHFRTPNLDQLAKSGVRLSQFYVTGATCGPSRAGMLTGRYQQRFGFEEINVPGIMSPHSKLLGDEMGLPTDLPTMGNHLQQLGYRTAVFGKWHMGVADRYHPLERGFDVFYGFRGGARSFFAYPKLDSVPHENWMEQGFKQYQEHDGYLTNVLAEKTCDFIRHHSGQPFFAYVSFNAVHTPMQADPQDRDLFAQLTGERRTAAQMMLSLDRACGQIIECLKDADLIDNTLIVFSNDNGGPMDRNGSSNYPLSGVKGTQLEGGIRVPGVLSWPGKIKPDSVYDAPTTTLDLLPTFIAAAGGSPAELKDLDGVDLLPYLQGAKPGRPHETLYWKMETRGAIRDGDWKLLRYPDRPAELFDLASDPSEQKDLATTHPRKVKDLFAKLFAWEMELQRPLFMLRRAEEGWSARRATQFRQPPDANY